jgi:flagellar hook assembly protein FlgD
VLYYTDVQVSIFDVSGRLVKVLEKGNLAAGEYSRIWQGRDEGGRPVASGAYYVPLVVDNMIDHRKIMLLK